MPGLVPGIHVFAEIREDVDGRGKPGHDDRKLDASGKSVKLCYGTKCCAAVADTTGRLAASEMAIPRPLAMQA
jgi:hypothetical protein